MNNPSDLLLFHGKRALPVIKFVANIKGFVMFDYKNVNFDFVHISSIPVFKSNLGPNQNQIELLKPDNEARTLLPTSRTCVRHR